MRAGFTRNAKSFLLFINSRPEYDFFSSPNRLSGRDNVKSDNVKSRQDIRQIFLKRSNKIQHPIERALSRLLSYVFRICLEAEATD